MLELRSGLIPTAPTTAQNASVVAWINQGQLPFTLCTLLLPYADVKDLPKVSSIPAGADLVSRLRLEFPNGQNDEVAISLAEIPPVAGLHRENTRALCVRKEPSDNTVMVIPPGMGPATVK